MAQNPEYSGIPAVPIIDKVFVRNIAIVAPFATAACLGILWAAANFK